MSGDRYHITDQNAMYFLTFTVTDWVDVFSRKAYKIDLVESLAYCQHKGLIINAWCIMTNHMHLIGSAKEGFRLSDIIRDFKKFTAKTILNRMVNGPESRRDWMLYRFEYAGKFKSRISKYKSWRDDNHAVLLDNNKMMEQRLDYVHDNPVEAMIVDQPGDYVFSSARDYAGQKSLLKIEFIESVISSSFATRMQWKEAIALRDWKRRSQCLTREGMENFK